MDSQSLSGSCVQCGTELSPAARFCSQCGTPVNSDHKPAASPASDDSRFHRLIPRAIAKQLLDGEGQVASERRTVTTLFADVVGSTSLAERYDPEVVTRIVNGAFNVFTTPITAADGTLARLMGDGVLCLFGAPVAHEDDPVRACRAALDILEGSRAYAETLKTEYDFEFAVRVGITTGLAVVGEVGTASRVEYTAIGDAVNLAARLQSEAAPGTALIDRNTHDRIGHAFATTALGEVSLKGKSRPVPVFRLDGQRQKPSVRHHAQDAIAMVGREAELAALTEEIRNRPAAQGKVITIVGAAGIGKSRLLEEARAEDSATSVWVEGRCMSHTSEVGYWAVTEILREILDIDTFGSPGAALQRFREVMDFSVQQGESAAPSQAVMPTGDAQPAVPAALALLLGLPRSAAETAYLDSLGAGELKAQVPRAFSTFLRAYGARHRLTLVWDDIHWIDRESLDVLLQLCREIADLPITLVLAHRPLAGEGADWSAQLEECIRGRAREIPLGPLSPDDSRRLLRALRSECPLPRTLEDRVLALAEGNPFCIVEMLRTIGSAGSDKELEGYRSTGAGSDISAPSAVQGAILARVDALPMQEKQVLRTASAIGRTFHPDILFRVLEPRIPHVKLTEALSALTEQHFITKTEPAGSGDANSDGGAFRSAIRLAPQPGMGIAALSGFAGPQYVFSHALVAEVIYKSLLRTERQGLHARTGRTMEALFADRKDSLAPILAYHFEKGGPPEKALEYLIKSAERAKGIYALDHAIDCYRRAMPVLPDGQDAESQEAHVRWAEGLGDVYYLRSDYRDAADLYDSALRRETLPARRATLFRKQGRVYEKWNRWDDARQAFESGLAELHGDGDKGVAASLYAGLSMVHCHQGDLQLAADVCRRALEMAGDAEDARGVAQACSNLGLIHAQSGDALRAAEYYLRSIETLKALGDRYGLAACYNNLGCLAKEAREWDQAMEHFYRSLTLFEALENRHAIARVCDNISEVFYEQGQRDEAEKYLERAVTILAEIGMSSSGPIAEMWQSGTW